MLCTLEYTSSENAGLWHCYQTWWPLPLTSQKNLKWDQSILERRPDLIAIMCFFGLRQANTLQYTSARSGNWQCLACQQSHQFNGIIIVIAISRSRVIKNQNENGNWVKKEKRVGKQNLREMRFATEIKAGVLPFVKINKCMGIVLSVDDFLSFALNVSKVYNCKSA